MDFFSKQQLWGVVLFFVGGWILSYCSGWERKRQEQLRDPKVRWAKYGKRKSDVLMPTSVWGTLMTLAGAGLAVWGFILFLSNIKS